MSYYPVGALLALPRLRGVEGSPGDRLKETVNHEAEPVSPMLSRLTVPVWDMCLLIVGGTEKVALLPDLLKLRESWRPEPYFSSSVSHLSISADGGRRRPWGGRWMEVVNRQKEQESGRERSEGEMYGGPHRLRQNDRWGDYGAGLLSTVIKVREPPCTTQVDSQPITLVDRVKIQVAGNTLHFNVIFHSIGQNSLLKSLHCRAMLQLSIPFVEKEQFFDNRRHFSF